MDRPTDSEGLQKGLRSCVVTVGLSCGGDDTDVFSFFQSVKENDMQCMRMGILNISVCIRMNTSQIPSWLR